MALTTSPQTDPVGSTPADRRGLRSPRLLRWFALAAAITNGGIAVTGATVRVTGSGLGCETWPECQPGTLIPEYRTGLEGFHQAIEFGNRTLTGLVLLASLGTFALLLLQRPARPQLILLGAVGPAGVLFQALWGGIVVRTELAWWTVAPHMIISLILLFFAILVVVRLRESDEPPRAVVPRPLQITSSATVGVLAALCIVGTLVTAAGPHGGDVDTPRLELSVRALAQAHADLLFLYLGMLVALVAAFYAVKAPRLLLRRIWLLVALTVVQGTIGLVQFAIGVPEVLVILHVLGSVLVVAAGAAMVFATRERPPAPVPAA